MKNLPRNSNLVSEVYSTTDYGWFKFAHGNRATDHVQALVSSMREKNVPNAILCNKDGEIIDGQNRFLALKQLGLPILFYIIDDLNIYDVAALNSYGKNWRQIDYIKMWASLGLEEYIKALQFFEMFPLFTISSALIILGDSMATGKGYLFNDESAERHKTQRKIDPLRKGEFAIKDWNRAVSMAKAIMEYEPFGRPGENVYRHAVFISAMMKLLRSPGFDNKEMVACVRKHPDMFHKCINIDNYLRMLSDIYNYQRKSRRKNLYDLAVTYNGGKRFR